MPTTLKVEKESTSSDCKIINIADTTGVYTASNPGYRGEMVVNNSAFLSTHVTTLSFTVAGVTYTVISGSDYAVTSGDDNATAAALSAAIIGKTANISSVVVNNKVLIFPTGVNVLNDVFFDSEANGVSITEEYRDREALKVFVLLMKSTGRETMAVPAYTPNGTTPTKDWAINIVEDGWYEVYSILVPIFKSGKTYLLNNIVYSVPDSKYYKVKVATTTASVSTASDWAECVTVEDFELGTNSITDVHDSVVICWSNKCLAKANALYVATAGAKQSTEKLDYEQIRNYVEGAMLNEDLFQYSQSQAILEFVAQKCNRINCRC